MYKPVGQDYRAAAERRLRKQLPTGSLPVPMPTEKSPIQSLEESVKGRSVYNRRDTPYGWTPKKGFYRNV